MKNWKIWGLSPFILLCLQAINVGDTIIKEDFNRWFDGENELWSGGDGVYTIEMEQGRILWLFGDTIFGTTKQNHRHMDSFINNSIALQEKSEPWLKPQFIIPKDQNNIRAFFTPPDQNGWFWPLHGIKNEHGLFVFLLQITYDPHDPVFAFRIAANYLATINNPQELPEHWQIEYQRLPWYQSEGQARMYGNYVIADDSHVLIYGIEEKLNRKYLHLAKVPADKIANTADWSFYQFGHYQPNVDKSTRLLKNMPIEFSIHKKDNAFILTAMDDGLSAKILRRYAPSPGGPWSSAQIIYECPEVVQEPAELFCYAAKTQPFLQNNQNGEVFSYVVNSYRPERAAQDATIYKPRFVLYKKP